MNLSGQEGVLRVCVTGKAKSLIRSCLAIGGLVMTMSAAQAATVAWEFNLPATGNPSLDPVYPSVARLTLADSPTVGDYVEFTLDPNEANPGYGSNSTVDALNIAYGGTADLSSTSYEWVSGPVADPDSFGNRNNPLVAIVPSPASAGNMDAGYKSEDGQLKLTWSNPDFPVDGISVWRIYGTSIADNFSLLASGNNKPSPTFGVISVSPISQFDGGPVPNPSNWVTGPSPVPLPATFWLFGSGILGIIGIARRKL